MAYRSKSNSLLPEEVKNCKKCRKRIALNEKKTGQSKKVRVLSIFFAISGALLVLFVLTFLIMLKVKRDMLVLPAIMTLVMVVVFVFTGIVYYTSQGNDKKN